MIFKDFFFISDLVDQVGDLASGLADGASDLLEGASDLASDLVDKLLGEVPDGLDIVVDLLKIGLQADDVCDTACPLVLLAAGYTDLTPLCSMGCGL